MNGDDPDAARPTLAQIFEKLGHGLEHVGHTLTAQAAFGWMYRGRLDDAREVLARLPTGALQQVSVAAAALSTLADELAAGRPPEIGGL